MDKLEVRNLTFDYDGKEIKNSTKGPQISIDRKRLKDMIAKGEPTVTIPVEGEKTRDAGAEK